MIVFIAIINFMVNSLSEIIDPSNAHAIRNIAELSDPSRLPSEEDLETILNALDVYIDSEGEDEAAHMYLWGSRFIQQIAARVSNAVKSCTTKNLSDILSYMEENETGPLVLTRYLLEKYNPEHIINFCLDHMPNQLNTHTEWKILFEELEKWTHNYSQAMPNYADYFPCIYGVVFVDPIHKRLLSVIQGGYAKGDENNILESDEFTQTQRINIYSRQTQDLGSIVSYLWYLAELTKNDIFALLMVDPNDIQEWQMKKDQ